MRCKWASGELVHSPHSGDGTFRLMTEPWILLTLGVATKHYATGEDDHMKACRTTYNPLLFAIVNTESEATYRRLFSAAKTVAQYLFQADWRIAVRQYHADWHAGENNARAIEFPASIRAGDWAHFVGATARPKEAPIANLCRSEADCRAAWRAGVFHTTRQRLVRDENIDYIRSWIYSMRVQPTALLFTYMAHYFFAALIRKGEGEAAAFLQRQYFRKLPKAEAQAAYGIASWPGDPAFIWTADWWAGVERAQPGSAGASQAHRGTDGI